MYYFGNNIYNSITGNYLSSKDFSLSIKLNSSSSTTYSYVSNNPVNYTYSSEYDIVVSNTLSLNEKVLGYNRGGDLSISLIGNSVDIVVTGLTGLGTIMNKLSTISIFIPNAVQNVSMFSKGVMGDGLLRVASKLRVFSFSIVTVTSFLDIGISIYGNIMNQNLSNEEKILLSSLDIMLISGLAILTLVGGTFGAVFVIGFIVADMIWDIEGNAKEFWIGFIGG